MTHPFTIGPCQVSQDSPSFIIAEIGINHNGDPNLAKRLIDAAVEAKVDCVKFQMRDMETLYANAGNPNDAKENLSTQYLLDLLVKFELPNDVMFELFDYAKQKDLFPMCTPWDLTSLASLESYGMEAYKVASADMTNHELLTAIAKTKKPIVVSTGMSYEEEILQAVTILKEAGANYALLQCNSTYPPHPKDIHLRYLASLASIGDCIVGYSGHERGYHVPMAAVALGARIIEKHITIDRTLEGNDHKVSLLPDEFKSMVHEIREVELALGTAKSRTPNQGELMNRINLAKSIVINRDLKKGETITREMLNIVSPGRGIQPNRIHDLVGKKAKRDLKNGDVFFEEDVSLEITTVARSYSFERKWGIPVRWHDYAALLNKSNPDFLEFHLSYKDMDMDFRDFIKTPMDLGLVVHSPDTFAGDHLLNLAADDSVYRERSVQELQRVIDLTRDLKPYFNEADPTIVVSVGGFTKDRFLGKEDVKHAYETVNESLKQLDSAGVTITPQTLPPYPWYFGGQLFCNLFVHPEDTAWFCETFGHSITFDVSHSRLAANYHNVPFENFVDRVGPYTRHLHLVDALGTDSEGLQIGEGDIDFHMVANKLKTTTPQATFIPEIWMGHENEGEKQWVALERLEAFAF